MQTQTQRTTQLPAGRLLGALALLSFGIHGGAHLLRGTAHDVLWACTMANALIAAGLLLPWRRGVAASLCAVAVLWLTVGNVTWALDLILGGEFFWTSLLTHWLGLLLGVLGLRQLGWPPRAWLYATLGLIALQLVCRLATPAAANVNVAHAVYPGYARIYPSYPWFWLASFAQTATAYFVIDRILRRWLAGPAARAAGPPGPR
jgi:hypothetical protein